VSKGEFSSSTAYDKVRLYGALFSDAKHDALGQEVVVPSAHLNQAADNLIFPGPSVANWTSPKALAIRVGLFKKAQALSVTSELCLRNL
jgi:hypothetical protein